MGQIEIINGGQRGSCFQVKLGQFILGRSDTVDFVVKDPDISREHAKIEFDGTDLIIEDLQSTNGIFVNRAKIFGPTILENNDLVLIGQTAFLYTNQEDVYEKIPEKAKRLSERRHAAVKDIQTSLIVPGLDANELNKFLGDKTLQSRLDSIYAISTSPLKFSDLSGYVNDIFHIISDELPYEKLIAFYLNDDVYEVIHFQARNENIQLEDISQTVLDYCVENQQVVWTNYAQIDDRFQDSDSLRMQSPLAIICAPMVVNGKTIGVLSLDTLNEKANYSDQDLLFISACAANLASALLHDLSLKQLVENERKKADLRIAREIQMRSVPSVNKLPSLPGIDLAAYYHPFEEVGGDYFDVCLQKGMATFFNADVSGKGVSAALIVSLLNAYMKTIMPQTLDPHSILCHLQNYLTGDLPKKMFVTASAVTIDLEQQLFHYSRAGHTYLIYYSSHEKEAHLLNSKGIMIGVSSTDIFSSRLERLTYSLHPGDILMLYTDGFTEIRNERDELFGEQRIAECIAHFANRSANEILKEILNAINNYRSEDGILDDMCALLIKQK